nr:MAG TPA: hypothetical protein [Caudoviricetes sp.]
MSTTYYICRKQDYDRSQAIIGYEEKIRQHLLGFLEDALPDHLKDDFLLADDLEEAIAPMCSKLNEHIGYDPEVRFCTITSDRVVWHREEIGEAGFQKGDELVVIDEYGEAMTLEVFLASNGAGISDAYRRCCPLFSE